MTSKFATWSAQAVAKSRAEGAASDISARFSLRRAWTRANSASICRAHVAKSSEVKAAQTADAPEEDREPARAAAARARRAASASSLTAAGAAASGESPIVEETGHRARHSSHSEISQRQSPQQSQRNITAAVAAYFPHSSSGSEFLSPQQIRQFISHLQPVSLTMLLSFLRASLGSQQPDRPT